MPVLLEGGCLVTGLREGEALERGNLKVWWHISRAVGARPYVSMTGDDGARRRLPSR